VAFWIRTNQLEARSQPEQVRFGKLGWRIGGLRTWVDPDSGGTPLSYLRERKESVIERERSLDCWSEAWNQELRFPRGLWKKSPYEGKEIDLQPPICGWGDLVSDKGEKDVPWARSNRCLVWTRERCHMPQWQLPIWKWEIFKANYPADYNCRRVWIRTRGWFLLCMPISVDAFSSVAFKNVIANGLAYWN